MPADFAIDHLDAVARAALAARIGAEPTPAWVFADLALVDAAAFHARLRRRSWPAFNAYASSNLSAFEEQGVWLLPLEPTTERASAQIQDLLAWTDGAPVLSWLYTAAEQAALQGLASYLAQIKLEDRAAPLHCRFADTRVLPELLQALDPAQRARVAQLIQRWGWIGRNGEIRHWQSEPDAAADEAEHLRLSAAQFRRIRAAAEPDAIFALLLEQTPSLVPARDRGQFHAHLCAILATADRYHVYDLESRLQFVVLSLSCGEDFHHLPCLQELWADLALGKYRMVDRMQLWGDDVWDQLEANAPSRTADSDGAPA